MRGACCSFHWSHHGATHQANIEWCTGQPRRATLTCHRSFICQTQLKPEAQGNLLNKPCRPLSCFTSREYLLQGAFSLSLTPPTHTLT
jgi:hypothetical protein